MYSAVLGLTSTDTHRVCFKFERTSILFKHFIICEVHMQHAPTYPWSDIGGMIFACYGYRFPHERFFLYGEHPRDDKRFYLVFEILTGIMLFKSSDLYIFVLWRSYKIRSLYVFHARVGLRFRRFTLLGYVLYMHV